MNDDFIEHNGIIVKFTPDDTVAKERFVVVSYTGKSWHRMAYYEVRYSPYLTDVEREAMVCKVKETLP